ncbi:MAG TPA: hypothetical protein GX707_14975 [Epulopiscium sp.]|nr:hypothetical protein [Candidatus Epulonipiscium sp.]
MSNKENKPHRIILLNDAILYQKTQALTSSCLIYYKNILNIGDYNHLALMLFRLNSKIAKAFAVGGNRKTSVSHINYAFGHYNYMKELFVSPPLEIQILLDDMDLIIIKFKTKYKKELNKNENTI